MTEKFIVKRYRAMYTGVVCDYFVFNSYAEDIRAAELFATYEEAKNVISTYGSNGDYFQIEKIFIP